MRQFIQKLVNGEDLTGNEAESAMNIIMSGKASDIEISAFLTALKMKGETAEEIASFAIVMRNLAHKINPRINKTLVDVCGTGGDSLNTFNISTTSMFVVAAAGIPVAKHGNRSITSRCGSADVLEELGVNISMPPNGIQESIERIGIGFMFAPLHHSAMRHVMHVRKELGIRTIFNILGPLTNPADARAQLMGVFNPELTEKIAKVFKILAMERCLVVYGYPGLDELSTLGKTKISELRNGKIDTYFIKPEDFGFRRAKKSDIRGGDKKFNADILVNILKGKDNGFRRDIVLLNAAAGILIGGKADNLDEGLNMGEEILNSGRAYKKLNDFIQFTNLPVFTKYSRNQK